MAKSNPYEPPTPNDQHFPAPANPPDPARQAYNVVTDIVAGPNVRWKDNLFQAIAILPALAFGAGVGYVWMDDKPLGLFVGAGAGLLVGVFGSGFFLMIWRAVQHARGRHD